jgi:hypothetical protein
MLSLKRRAEPPRRPDECSPPTVCKGREVAASRYRRLEGFGAVPQQCRPALVRNDRLKRAHTADDRIGGVDSVKYLEMEPFRRKVSDGTRTRDRLDHNQQPNDSLVGYRPRWRFLRPDACIAGERRTWLVQDNG